MKELLIINSQLISFLLLYIIDNFNMYGFYSQLVSDRLLKERLEIDTLQEMKVLDNKNFHTKFIKIKTKL